MFRVTVARYAAQTHNAALEAVVVGGGPAGLAVVGNLLEHLPKTSRNQLWVDPSFTAGRVNARYRQVPSNTKVDLFLQFAKELAPFRHIIESTQRPNAITALEGLVQDKGCELGYGADMCLMLTKGLAKYYQDAQQHTGMVTGAVLNKATGIWTVKLNNTDAVTAKRLILCTGSSPIDTTPRMIQQNIQQATSIHLDTALNPSLLAASVSRDAPTTIAVVGASHSAILVLMNLYNLAASSHPRLRIKWFSRHRSLRYAKPMDGWILYDNTGLKGDAAQWARENLEESSFSSSSVSKVITKVFTSTGASEEQAYHAELPDCTHIVQAIGYQRDPLPSIDVTDSSESEPSSMAVEHDGLTGRFVSPHIETYVPGLFGAGIAFPERVTDPAGNIEHAVGFWKFMRFLKRVVPQWVQEK